MTQEATKQEGKNPLKYLKNTLLYGATWFYSKWKDLREALHGKILSASLTQPSVPSVVPVHQQANKEQRIVATLDPIINGGRMVFTPEAVMGDYLSAQDKGVESYGDYTLTAQISNFTTRDKLPFDDRLDALAGVGAKLAPYLAITPMKQEQDAEYERLKEILERPIAYGSDNTVELSNRPPVTSPWCPSRRKYILDNEKGSVYKRSFVRVVV
jgi:hypothetical protein